MAAGVFERDNQGDFAPILAPRKNRCNVRAFSVALHDEFAGLKQAAGKHDKEKIDRHGVTSSKRLLQYARGVEVAMRFRKFFGHAKSGKLPPTRWSVVVEAGHGDKAARQKAFADLYAIYWMPVFEFIRARGWSAEEARDLTQGFFTTRLLEKNDVAAADKTVGRFRNWLLTAVKSYLKNDLDMRRAHRRDPGTPLISIDAPEVEGGCPVQIGHPMTPERIYQQRWAFVLLQQALDKLRRSYEERGQSEVFEQVLPFLVHLESGNRRTAAKEIGMQPDTFKVAVWRGRNQFHDLIRAEIAETVSSEEEVEHELRYLRSGLQAR